MALDSEERVAPLPNLPSGVAPAKPALEAWSCCACVRSTRRLDFFTTSKPALRRGSDTSDEVRESLRDE